MQSAVSGSFWNFLGYLLLISIFVVAPINAVVTIVTAFCKKSVINKNGYPPEHCDSLGNFYTEAKDDEKQ